MAFFRGSVRFDDAVVQTVAGQGDKLFDVTCVPPPAGTITRHNPKLIIGPVLETRFLQQRERDALEAFAKKPGENALTMAAILADLGAAFGLQTITVDPANVPADWDQAVACFDTSVSYEPSGEVHEIRARVTEDMTLGAELFPAGDEVATFRVWAPLDYRFVRRYRWNPECCSETARVHEPDYSTRFPLRLIFPLPDGWQPKDRFRLRFGGEYKWNREEDGGR